MERTISLIEQAHGGDKEVRERLIEENMGLVYTVARRFMGRGCEWEDLIQIGSIGLIKAIDKFDPRFEVCFSTYAVPVIGGEIRRFLRDDGMLKISRTLKETAALIASGREQLEKVLGREPTVEELEKKLGLGREEMMLALEASAQVDSIDRPIRQGDGKEICLAERLEEKKDEQEKLLNRMFLKQLLGQLEEPERKLIWLRYFQEKTQVEIAGEFGISQVQVSRLEKKILQRMRKACSGL